MKIKILLTCGFIMLTGILIAFSIPKNDKIIIKNESNSRIINTGAITMMYETETGSGEYQVSTDSTWPGNEYIFNEILSKCENGGKLSWNNDTQRIVMQTNTSDKCYVYFDKYNMPQITEVVATEVTSNSITINVIASDGDGYIVSFHYSINDGEYISSNSNSYTFNNLEAETSYDISVYVTDSNGRTSNIEKNIAKTENNLITFNITVVDYSGNSESYTYYAEKGMTWKEFVNSKYNDGKFKMCADDDSYYPDSIAFRGLLSNLSKTDIINDYDEYIMTTASVTMNCENESVIL